MKVRVKDEVYDSTDEPIMLYLDEIDKDNIFQMEKGEPLYARFPKGTDPAEAEKWMNEGVVKKA